MTTMPANEPLARTWVFDSFLGTVRDIDGTELPQHRFLLRNDGVGFLYNNQVTQHVARIDGAEVRADGERWIMRGTDDAGNDVEWSMARSVKRAGCSSCGGARR